jgi:hypothetical protein
VVEPCQIITVVFDGLFIIIIITIIINKFVLYYILLHYLIIRSRHKGDALPKNGLFHLLEVRLLS